MAESASQPGESSEGGSEFVGLSGIFLSNSGVAGVSASL